MKTPSVLACALLLGLPGAFALAADPPSSGDPLPSSATIDDPGGVLEGVVELRGSASAREGFELVAVRIIVDGVTHGVADGTDRWTYALDTATLPDGAHQVTALALAKPADTPTLMAAGGSASIDVATENGIVPLVLLDQTMTFTGWQPVRWTHRLTQDVTGLRLLLSSDGDARGTASLLYTDHLDEGPAGTSRLVAMAAVDGIVVSGGPGGIAVNPDAALQEAGVLSLDAQFAGEGTLRLRVEAVAAPP